MKEHPILFSTPMVQAILEGRKSMTRRVPSSFKFINENPSKWLYCGLNCDGDALFHAWDKVEPFYIKDTMIIKCPYRVGDRLWVRETFVLESDLEYVGEVKLPTDRPILTIPDDGEWGEYHLIPHYKATEPEPNIVSMEQDSFDDRTRWKPSIFMPRWASRITLKITDIKVERLHITIKYDEVAKEGWPFGFKDIDTAPVNLFIKLWDSINGKKHPWESNPWVWVIEFKKI